MTSPDEANVDIAQSEATKVSTFKIDSHLAALAVRFLPYHLQRRRITTANAPQKNVLGSPTITFPLKPAQNTVSGVTARDRAKVTPKRPLSERDTDTTEIKKLKLIDSSAYGYFQITDTIKDNVGPSLLGHACVRINGITVSVDRLKELRSTTEFHHPAAVRADSEFFWMDFYKSDGNALKFATQFQHKSFMGQLLRGKLTVYGVLGDELKIPDSPSTDPYTSHHGRGHASYYSRSRQHGTPSPYGTPSNIHSSTGYSSSCASNSVYRPMSSYGAPRTTA